MAYILIQDNDVLEHFDSKEEAASMVRSISEALRADATRFERMADSIDADDDNDWHYSGSYLELTVDRP